MYDRASVEKMVGNGGPGMQSRPPMLSAPQTTALAAAAAGAAEQGQSQLVPVNVVVHLGSICLSSVGRISGSSYSKPP